MEPASLPSSGVPRRQALFLVFAALTSAPMAAMAQAPAAPKKKKKKKSSANAAGDAKPVGKTTFSRGSEETTAERDRRLYRECQGRPNAGACAGYAR
jgi:hypothetical protein